VPDAAANELRARADALQARLDSPRAPSDLAALKVDIGALFRDVEHQIAQLTAVRESVKQLIDHWKAIKDAQPSVTPHADGTMPTVHADYLGASTFVERGWNKISVGDYEAADRVLKQALELSPNDSHAESLLGWSEMLQDKFDDAMLTFQKVLVREPQNALARVNVGYICLKKRIFGEAIEHLARVIRLNNDKKATLYAHFYLGLVYLEREMLEDAQTFLEKAIALGPNLSEAYYELGRAYWLSGKRDEAVRTWTSGHESNKFSPWATRCAEVLATMQGGGEL